MGTDVCSSLGSLSAELENAKRSLHKIDDDIKKIVQTTGRFQIDRLVCYFYVCFSDYR